MTLGALAAVGVLVVVAWIYRVHGRCLLSFRVAPGGAEPASPGVVAIEWLGLMVAWLAFGPEVARRHMFVLLLLHSTVLAFLAHPDLRFQRKPLIIALIVWQAGLRLPPSHSPVFQGASMVWNAVSGTNWYWREFYLVLLWSTLKRSNAEEERQPPVVPMRASPLQTAVPASQKLFP